MANLSVSTKDDNNREEEFLSIADKENGASSTYVSRTRSRILHRVPKQVRETKKYIYDPVVLSIGPYHHGKPQFHLVEELKDEVLDIMLDSATGAKIKDLFYIKILGRVDNIRNFYRGISTNKYNDEALAEMTLRDAYFVLYYMDMALHSCIVIFCMLENQIPLWVIKFLISLTFDDKDKEEALLYKFTSYMNFGDHRLTRAHWENKEQEPLHILEAHRMSFVKEESITIQPIKFIWGWRKSPPSSLFEMANGPFRSVTYLKAKGIHFGPSSNCLKDITFEMSPETNTDFAVISYVNFMKTLIENPKDVKELREKGILFSCLANDEEVVKIFKEIDTYGMDNINIFQDVKMRIHEYYASKAKTWMAELIHTYFCSPWTAIALFVATFLLCLTIIQTYYTVHPRNGN
ncbi:hypothetical protein Pfo_016336 [Paulownia fortunei]|nr:hypothetical protein Pfo_016336 [Paulownia fortunei]